jgi:type I restriction enzyme, S subunit
MNWREKQLGDVIRLKRGHDLPAGERVSGEIPIVSSSGITGYHNVAKAAGPGVVTGRYGTLGEVHYIEGDYWPLNTHSPLTSEDLDRKSFPYYVSYLNTSGSLNGLAPKTSRLERIKQVSIANTLASRCRFVFPDLRTQQSRIAFCAFSAYDDLIATNQRRIALLEAAARRLYREWFVHLRFPGHESVPVRDGVPEGWKFRPLGEIAPLNYGKALKASDRNAGVVPVYGSSGIVGCHNQALIGSGAIILGRKGNVGSLYYSATPCFPIDTVFYIEPDLTTYRLYLALHTLNFISSDAAVPGLNRTYAQSLPLLIPSEDVSTAFESVVSPMFEQTEVLRLQNAKLTRARDLLLPKLISGQLDVSGIQLSEEPLLTKSGSNARVERQ